MEIKGTAKKSPEPSLARHRMSIADVRGVAAQQQHDIHGVDSDSDHHPSEKHSKAKKTALGFRTDDRGFQDDGKKKEVPRPRLGLFQMMKFSNAKERALMVIGILAAWAAGYAWASAILLKASLWDAFVRYALGQQAEEYGHTSSGGNGGGSNEIIDRQRHGNRGDGDTMSSLDFEQQYLNVYIETLMLLGMARMVSVYVMSTCLNVAAERQVHRIRGLFLKAILRQDMAWFDAQQVDDVARYNAENFMKLKDGIGECFGMINVFSGSIVTCLVVAFLNGWRLTLILLSVTPVAVISSALAGRLKSSRATEEMKAYSKAGSAAQEVLAAVRTVVCFGGQSKEVERYETKLHDAAKAGIRCGLLMAISAATYRFFYHGTFALAMWYGMRLALEQRDLPDAEYDILRVTLVVIGIAHGGIYIGLLIPYAENFARARAAAEIIYDVIDRVPLIDINSDEGLQPPKVTGTVKFDNVTFGYPTRPDAMVLDKFTVEIGSGQSLALVGESGSGKSTVIQLLLRFYDPQHGSIHLDGHNIRTVNLGWLRDNIGIVGQEPVLFNATIAENIMYGLEGATMEDVERAAREANAHDFIIELPQKYETLVGSIQLSGGQKQRVAIARALIRNPKILLLDEATSALDSESEEAVQNALNEASKGRTTFIVSHRLSTVRNSDKIAVMSKGRIVEVGTHQELMALVGLYHRMVSAQSMNAGKCHSEESAATMTTVTHEDSADAMPNCNKAHTMGAEEKAKTADGSAGDVKDKLPWASESKIATLYRQEWPYVLVGCIGALGVGLSYPMAAILNGDIYSVLADMDTVRATRNNAFYAYMSVVLGVAATVSIFLQIFMLTYAGEMMTQRLRKMTLAAMLRQEIGWFDDPKNNVGALCMVLSGDAYAVQMAAGYKLGIIMEAACSLVVSVVVSMVISWKLGLVGIGVLSIGFVATYVGSKNNMRQSASERSSLESANKIATDVVSNIRTVAALHGERFFHGIYMRHLSGIQRTVHRHLHFHGIVLGITQTSTLFTYGICLYYGGHMFVLDDLQYGDALKVAEMMMLGTITLGTALAFVPLSVRGAMSAARIIQIVERQPKIDSSGQSGIVPSDTSPGRIDFVSTSFSYPTRSDAPVLRDLSLTIEAGQVLALVGTSGCGKSTCVQLLQRLYDPNDGRLILDDVDIAKLNVTWLRSRMGIVSQEPVLFNRSIADNIAYGDNSRRVPMQDIIKSATEANIHRFIAALPQGYDTLVGDKGTQLSGGQKQRIAIARALVRNPKILLLDEATSALDTKDLPRTSKPVRWAARIAAKCSATVYDGCLATKIGISAEFSRHRKVGKRCSKRRRQCPSLKCVFDPFFRHFSNDSTAKKSPEPSLARHRMSIADVRGVATHQQHDIHGVDSDSDHHPSQGPAS